MVHFSLSNLARLLSYITFDIIAQYSSIKIKITTDSVYIINQPEIHDVIIYLRAIPSCFICHTCTNTIKKYRAMLVYMLSCNVLIDIIY